MDHRILSHCIVGTVRTGLGHGAGFTSLPRVRQQFIQALGIDPYPGTLNLELDPGAIPHWRSLTATPGHRLAPERATDCAARCYPVRASRAGGSPVTAAIVVPEVPGYAPEQVEVVASVSLREVLGLADGDVVTLDTVPARNRRAVLFDVDGTLVNSIDGYRLAAERAVQPFGWSVSPEAVSRAMNFGDPFWDLVVPPESLGNEALIAQLRRDTMAHWPAVLDECVLVYPGIGGILKRLKSEGVRLGICTASRGESFRPLEQAGLLEFFEEIVTARDVLRRKPDPEGILLCMERMGVAACETIYIGDTVADMRASHAAGLYAVGVLTGAGTSSLLSGAGAHRILADLQHLPAVLFGGDAVAPAS
ncbi:MAG: HAD-IA family hydrolase [Chromatiales bacterium]|nr:HAD-IA family hydrolase [Chromatiales bacterium]